MRMKHLALALVALAGALTAFSPIAAANRIAVNPAGMVRKMGPLQITDSNGTVITCQVTYNETWQPLITKAPGFVAAVVGGLATAEGCVSVGQPIDQVILQLGQQSPKRFQSFTGTLPRIDSLLFIVEQLRILLRYRMPEVGCLYQGNVGFNTGGGPNRIDRLTVQPNQIVPLSLQLFGMIPCPLNIRLSGTLFMNPPLLLTLV